MTTTTYSATATRDGRFWAVEIHGLPPNHFGFTQGRTWNEAQEMARDAVASLLDVAPSTITILLAPTGPEEAEAIRALHAYRST